MPGRRAGSSATPVLNTTDGVRDETPANILRSRRTSALFLRARDRKSVQLGSSQDIGQTAGRPHPARPRPACGIGWSETRTSTPRLRRRLYEILAPQLVPPDIVRGVKIREAPGFWRAWTCNRAAATDEYLHSRKPYGQAASPQYGGSGMRSFSAFKYRATRCIRVSSV